MSKIYEKCILNYFKTLQTRSGMDLTGEFQHAYKEGSSTITALLELQENIASKIDQGYYVLLVSCDMTAAFDLVNKNVLNQRLHKKGFPEHFVELIDDWLSDRQAFVEVGGECSLIYDIILGVIQGSVLGAVLFALFLLPMEELKCGKLGAFADDTQNQFWSKSLSELIDEAEEKMAMQIKWLKDSGMVSNVSKTEAAIFYKNDLHTIKIHLGEEEIEVKKNIKLLGVIFDTKLTWSNHIALATAKATRTMHALKFVSHYFSEEERRKLITAYVYGSLLYGSEVWLHEGLKSGEWKSLNRIFTESLRVTRGDWKRRLSKNELMQNRRRATMREMSNFVQAKTLFKIVTSQKPEIIYTNLLLNHSNERRYPNRLFFTTSNMLKVGRNMFSNRMNKVSRKINFDWFDFNLSPHSFRMGAKKCFFGYIKDGV